MVPYTFASDQLVFETFDRYFALVESVDGVHLVFIAHRWLYFAISHFPFTRNIASNLLITENVQILAAIVISRLISSFDIQYSYATTCWQFKSITPFKVFVDLEGFGTQSIFRLQEHIHAGQLQFARISIEKFGRR